MTTDVLIIQCYKTEVLLTIYPWRASATGRVAGGGQWMATRYGG